MRHLLISIATLFAVVGFSQGNGDFEQQLKLKFSENYIGQLKEKNPNKYQFYIQELKSSFEFVELNPNLKYDELEPFDFHQNQPKEAPLFSVETFSLYHYKFIRYEDKDIVYKIPGSNQGILIYSKEKFNKKL